MKCFIGLFAACLALAQTPAFEVASIKPDHSAEARVSFAMQPGGRFSAVNVNTRQLIMMAYKIRPDQLSGGPSWIDSERFDITAKPASPVNPDQVPAMVQALLADRFHLVTRTETRQMPVYFLTVAKNGAKLQAAKIGDPGASLEPSGEPPKAGRGPQMRNGMMRIGRGEVMGMGLPISDFADQLSRALGRSVIDRTGLTGKYDYTLKWTPDETQGMFRGPGPGGPPAPNAPDAAPSDSSGPSIFSAIEDQLGLKLDAGKGPVEIYIVDKIERPSEN